MTDNKKIKNSISFIIATAISRILGYIRDMLVAHRFGNGILADSFYAAFRIPNLFRRTLGEGGVNAAFVPVFTKTLSNSKKDAEEFLSSLLTYSVIVLVSITIIGILFSDIITKTVAYGFDENKFIIAKNLVKIMFPFIAFLSISVIISGVLNTFGKFFIPALSPAWLSISEIFFLLLIIPIYFSIELLAISVTLGGFLQLLFQVPAFLSCGIKLKPSFKLHPAIKDFFIIYIPAIYTLSIEQINSYLDALFTSFLVDGSMTALYYSNRLIQLPLALFGIGWATVIMPILSKTDEKKELEKHLNEAINHSLFMLLPAVFGIIIVGDRIVKLLFEYGRFTTEGSELTYYATIGYAVGVVFFSLNRILISTFYSQKNSKAPFFASIISIFINLVLNTLIITFFKELKIAVGLIALTTSISAIASFLYLISKIDLSLKFKLEKIIPLLLLIAYIILVDNVNPSR
ncbi:MAG: murein biosynthesis integral membrane protein MurJ, partial [bacterium]|nr:murein biosynthesis integral membrane protein MurJ [bacterium]